MKSILTVGHSTHPWTDFVSLLQRNNVTAIADVRSSPFSRYNPQFNRESLSGALAAANIEYVFLGRELGARSEDPACYENGKVQYDRLARTTLFQKGIERVLRGAEKYRVAIMCAEKEPLECHRTILVSRVLNKNGCKVGHILASGDVETHDAAMDRLLRLTGVPTEDLFRPREALVADALARQEAKIAFANASRAAEQESDYG